MADELNKFVLQYITDTKDSLKKLEELTKKMDGVEDKAKKGSAALKQFASGATDEFGKLIPGINAAKDAVTALTAEFGLAAAAVLAIGVAIKSVIDLRAQFNTQRLVGQQIGTSPIWVENWRRQLRSASGGKVTEDQGYDALKTLDQLRRRAYQDPTFFQSEEAKKLRLLGVNVGTAGKPVSTNQFINSIATKLSSMSDAEAQGVGRVLGISPDAASAMHKLGGKMSQVTELSDSEVKQRINAQNNMQDFNKSLSDMTEKFKEAEMALAERLLPALTKLVDLLARVAGRIPDAVNNAADVLGSADQYRKEHPVKAWFAANAMLTNPLVAWKLLTTRRDGQTNQADGAVKTLGQSAQANADAADKNTKSAEKNAQTATEMANEDAKNNQDASANTDNMTRALNMFVGAVATFANAVNEQQAWAAWAGEIGRAAGLGSPQSTDRSQKAIGIYQEEAKTQFDDIFAAAAKKYNLPIELLKAHGKVESEFNPNTTSEKGAMGIMQLMPKIARAYGITNPYDPEQNIMGGARLIRENLDRYGDLNKAILAYHGGTDESQWGSRTQAYLGKVQGAMRDYMQAGAPAVSTGGPLRFGIGESKDSMALRAVQQNIAARLGVGLDQVQQGGVNRGDVSWALSQLEAGVQNNIKQMQIQLMATNLPQQVRSKLMTDIQNQQIGLAQMRTFGQDVVNSAQEGPRSITFGERAIIITVNDATDPTKTADEVHKKFQDNVNELLNGYADGISH